MTKIINEIKRNTNLAIIRLLNEQGGNYTLNTSQLQVYLKSLGIFMPDGDLMGNLHEMERAGIVRVDATNYDMVYLVHLTKNGHDILSGLEISNLVETPKPK